MSSQPIPSEAMPAETPLPLFDALVIPTTALDQGGMEVIRAAIVDGGLHVSLRRAFDDPDTWGTLIADLVRRIAPLYSGESGLSEQEVLERIVSAFETEMAEPSDPGQSSATS